MKINSGGQLIPEHCYQSCRKYLNEMSQRNILCTHQIYDLEIEPSQNHLNPEPCIMLSSMVDFPNPNNHLVSPASGNTTNHELLYPPDQHCNSMLYGNQYNSLHHHHPATSFDLGRAGPSNPSFNPYLIPSSASRTCPMPLDHGSSVYMPSSSNDEVIGIDEHGRNHHFMDRGSGKRKNGEGVQGSHNYISGPSSSSSSSLGVPMNLRLQQWKEPCEAQVGMLDAATFTPSEYRGSGILSISEGSRSVRSRSSAINMQLESGFVHHHNQFLQGNYMGRTFQPANNAWPEQFGNNNDGGSSHWNYCAAMPSSHGGGMNGDPVEIGSMCSQGHQDTSSSRNSGIVLRPSLHHHHSQQMQGMREGHTYSYHPQIPAPSHRHPTSGSHFGFLNLSRDGLESSSRYIRPFSSSGDRIYRPHRRTSQGAPDDINGRMRFLSSDDFAMLEFSGFHGVGNFIDQHRDMRLDIDDMSYEELLALEERIGDVCTGLSEETILSGLKTIKHVLCTASSASGHSADIVMQESGTCIICQVCSEIFLLLGVNIIQHQFLHKICMALL